MTIIDDTTVSVSTEVDAPLRRAFHIFTAEIGTWWDEDKHHHWVPARSVTATSL